MKKIMLIALALMMALGPHVSAQTDEAPLIEDAPLVEEAPPIEEAPLIEDADYRAEVAEGAHGLLAIMAQAMPDNARFIGAPDAELAWRALGVYANSFAEHEQVFDYETIQSYYADLFAYGTFEDIAEEASDQFRMVDGGYEFAAADGEATVQLALNSTDEYADDAVYADISIWTVGHSGYPQTLVGAAVATLVPGEGAFGARIGGWAPVGLPVFAQAVATATLDPQEGSTYEAMNAIDGDLTTCWAYPVTASDGALTLSADAPQPVRGVSITPGYAKSAYAFSSNLRVKTLAVTLDGGQAFTFELADVDKQAYEGMYVLAFDGIYEAERITFEVTDTHKGTHFDDICISEIVVF